MSIKCNHCQIAFENEVMIKENDLFFCCKGCQSVYYLLQDEDLGSFYNKLGNKTLASVKKHEQNDLNNFDEESFFKNYVKETQDGFSHIDLIIEGIHCSACVWLNEKILFELEGIIEAKINFTNNLIGKDEYIYTHNTQNFIEDICYARTFCLSKDIGKLRASGFGLGGNLNNAIVVKDNQILNDTGLRCNKEFVNCSLKRLIIYTISTPSDLYIPEEH